jgi:Rrf2 family protein
MPGVRISAKADYAVRAALELALAGDESMTAEAVAAKQGIPVQFLQKIFLEMSRARIVATQRGRIGGHRLARPADQISVADILRAMEGALADVHGQAPEDLTYPASAAGLQEVWFALRTNIREVLEHTTLADLAAQSLPERVTELAHQDGARVAR